MATLRRLPVAVLFAVLASCVVAVMSLQDKGFTDYELEAEPAVDALRRGDLHEFLLRAPTYGGSLILRAPFALLPGLWHGGGLAAFRALAVPALIAAAVLGLLLWRRLADAGRLGAAWAALIVCTASPLFVPALSMGHPEELLGGVLVAGAALAASRGRVMACGLLLGLALADKPWVVVAIVPVLLTLPAGRVWAGTLAAATAGLFLAPFLLVGGDGVHMATTVAHTSGFIFKPGQLWWFFGEHTAALSSGPKAGFREPPSWIGTVSRPLIVLAPVLLAVLLVGLRRRSGRTLQPADGLNLLALALLLRCLLDPWNIAYYEVPFTLALLVWELHTRSRIPWLTLAVVAASELTLVRASDVLTPDGQALAYLAWAVPCALLLGLQLLAPETAAALGRRAASAGRRYAPSLVRLGAAR
jgi:hypothetical protein